MKDDLDITISFGGKEVKTNLKQMNQLSSDLKAGKIQFYSKCCRAKHYYDSKRQMRCSSCGKVCEIEVKKT